MDSVRASIGPALAARYSVEHELGAGAMAVVYLAHDRKHDRRVAIKVLRPELASVIGADRFQREIEVVAGLTHPHILPLHDSGEAAGLLYYVMPYIEGESLRARLERDGRLSVPAAIRITREIADALGFAHRRGVIHRDVKPGNILLTEDHALLADFGIAHLAESEGSTLTGTGLALGTPAYFSPEQATGERDIDGRSDVYSLGCVLYEALAGQPPFAATSVRALISHHVLDAPPALREHRPEVSEGIQAVVGTALQKEPEKRFQTAEEMAGSLDLVSGGFEAMAAAALRKLVGPRRRWTRGTRLAALLTAAVVALVAVAIGIRSLLWGPGVTGPVATYMLVSYSGGGATEREAQIAERAVLSLYFQLTHWSSIRVVGPDALEGPIADLQLAGLRLPSLGLSAAQELAGRVGASHVVQVQALALGDSLALVATIRSRADPDEEERAIRRDGREGGLELITAGLALAILGLHGEPAEYEDLVQRSPSHAAHQQFRDGQIALYDWRLAEAEEHFRAAVAEDSAFALAHHYLAQTLYWRTARDRSRLLDFGPGERSHVQAFHALWTGDFERARILYDSILEFDPMSLEGLILRGSVELEDPWLSEGEDGALRPRLDLDLARAVYDSAAKLNSRWQLAWGRLFDIDLMLFEAGYRNGCLGYHPPDYAEHLTPYSVGDASVVSSYCPLIMDGVTAWVPGRFSAEDRLRAQAGAQQVHERTVQRLEHWAQVEKDQPRHHEELADWLLLERSVTGCAPDPATSDSLATLATAHLERALSARRDTTPEDRVRLATVRMADGDYEAARDAVGEALETLGDWRSPGGPMPPPNSANPFMALGEIHPTLDIIEAVYRINTAAVRDPANPDDVIDMRSAFATLYALQALGMMGQSGPQVVSRFDELDRTWPDSDYTERQRAILRWTSLDIVAPALIASDEMFDEWLRSMVEHDLELPAVWQGLMIADARPEEALRLLEDVIADLESAEPPDRILQATDFYLPLVLAERVGSDSLAADLRRRALTCPLDLHELDFGWGMKWNLAGAMGD